MDFAIWTGGPTPDRIIRGARPYVDARGIQHPKNIWTLWSKEDLAARLNAFPFTPALPPKGHRVTERTYALVSGQVVESIVKSSPKRLALPREELVSMRVNEVKDLTAAKMYGHMTYQGKPFQVDPVSQQRIQAEAFFAKLSIEDAVTYPWPSDYSWLAADNTQVAMTAAEMLAFAVAARTHVRQIIFNGRAHKDNLLKARSVKDAHEMDVSTGWP